MNERRRYAYTTSLAALILLGMVFYQYPATRLAYAHTFSGDESAAFIATVGVLRTELSLINSTIATNASLANEHANIAAEHLSKNDTSELAERNQRIGTDLPKDLSDLQNMTANISPSNTSGITAVNQKVSDTDALLGEALTVRIEPAQLRNATVYGWAVADILNETLERYGETLGIGENSSSSSSDTTATTAAAVGANESNNTTSNIVNYADYQSTIGLVNMTKEMLNQVKSLALSSSNSSTTSPQSNGSNIGTTTMSNTSTTTNSNAAVKIDSELDQLKGLIDNKSNYEQVATFVYNTIYPDLNSAFGLGLEKVDAMKAIEEARSGEEE